MELFGTIRLSYRQAEGRRVGFAALCLKYIALLAAAVLTFLCLNENGTRRAAFAFCAAAFALLAALLRGIDSRRAYLISAGFLREGGADLLPRPGIPALLPGELALLAARCAVAFFMLSPALVCMRYAVRYYSLSSDSGGFMLLISAALLLASGGGIFSAVILTRLGCAEFLWLSGCRSDMLSALDCSWDLTRGSSGDLLRLCLLSAFCAPGIGLLCRMNFSQRLLRRKGLPSSDGLRLLLLRDTRGEQRLDFF